MGLTRIEALEVLGLEDDASDKDIRERFKHLAKKWHPDKNLENPRVAEAKFQKLTAAYGKLTQEEEEEADESDDAILLAELLIELFGGRRQFMFDPTPNLFCDCINCQHDIISPEEPEHVWRQEREEKWRQEREDIWRHEREEKWRQEREREHEKKRGSDFSKEYEETAEKIIGDHLVSQWADKLFNNFNQPRRNFKKGDISTDKISSEEASRNAEQLLEAEEKAKKEKEKKKERNKRKKEAKKRRKAGSCHTSTVQESQGVVSSEVGSNGDRDKDSAEQEDAEDIDEDDLDLTSAFIARASKKQSSTSNPQPPSKPFVSSSNTNTPLNTDKVNGNITASRVMPHSPSGSQHQHVGTPPVTNRFTAGGAEAMEPNLARSRQLASLGNRAAKDGHYGEAVRRYTEAIALYPLDHRYFGNRSFCFDYLHEYSRALEDANKAIQLDVSWPKGYYRQGRAYYGLLRLEQAERSYMLALRYDPNYRDAEEELFKIRYEQLIAMGFPPDLCEPAVKEYKTVQAAIDAILAGKVVSVRVANGYPEVLPPQSDPQQHKQMDDPKSKYEVPPRMINQKLAPKVEKTCATEKRSLWVGNITSDDITEPMLFDLFKRFGDLVSVRLLHARRCAFVNFKEPKAAAEALNGLQGHHVGGCYLLLRYPESGSRNPSTAEHSIKKATGTTAPAAAVNGNECYYWRNTGCVFGDKCKWKHIPANKQCDMSTAP